MSCQCRIGGGPDGVCAACRYASANNKQNSTFARRILALEEEVSNLKRQVEILVGRAWQM